MSSSDTFTIRLWDVKILWKTVSYLLLGRREKLKLKSSVSLLCSTIRILIQVLILKWERSRMCIWGRSPFYWQLYKRNTHPVYKKFQFCCCFFPSYTIFILSRYSSKNYVFYKLFYVLFMGQDILKKRISGCDVWFTVYF